MARTVFVTGADRGLGLALCAGLLAQDWQVFAGQYMPEWPDLSTLASQYPQTLHIVPLDVSSLESAHAAARTVANITDHVDVLINNAGIYSPTAGHPIREPQDYPEMQQLYDVNALGPLRVVQAFLSLMDRSSLKRLCFVSSEAGSIARAERTAWFGYCMSKAALNMGVKILFNDLHPNGYTFRVYHPGWIRSYMSGEKNMEATLEPEEAAAKAIPTLLNQQQDEGRLVLVDYEGNEWPW
ncbi:MAG: SDR family NAD(P)-dependent oxidoreductase [Chloroflexi bacterium]|nr:MAG: SDR family NAD(P)-dependent oxidoreductase [Chloroflexota bacterium]